MEISLKQNPEGKPPRRRNFVSLRGRSASYGAGIFLQWLSWQFFDVPISILKAWKNFLRFNLNYFSIPLLAKTLFSHWRQYKWYYPRGLKIGKYLEVFVSNLISRILGAIMRSFLILVGILVEIFLFFIELIIFLGWLILPILLIWGLIFGFKIIF